MNRTRFGTSSVFCWFVVPLWTQKSEFGWVWQPQKDRGFLHGCPFKNAMPHSPFVAGKHFTFLLSAWLSGISQLNC